MADLVTEREIMAVEASIDVSKVKLLGSSYDTAKDTMNVRWSAEAVEQKPWVVPAEYFRRGDGRQFWNGALFNETVQSQMTFPARQSNDADVLRALHKYGIVFVDSLQGAKDTQEYLQRLFGSLHTTHYGTFWSWTSKGEFTDAAYGNTALPLHTDGTYFSRVCCPRLQILHCIDYKAEGGDNTFCDGRYLAALLKSVDPSAYGTLRRNAVTGVKHKDGVYLEASRPVICDDGHISFNTVDRKCWDPSHDLATLVPAYKAFADLTQDAENVATVQLRPGKAVMFDNWRVMHGRSGFFGRREMCGAYIIDDYFKSALRMCGVPVPK
jgi:trimethyllysine dioxygenase